MNEAASSPKKILIVDDHDMVRLGLRTYLSLEEDFEIIGEASNGQEALDLIERQQLSPDMILMDLMMPVMNGVEATRRIADLYPNVKIVLLTSFLEDEQVISAMEAGATTYVLKTVASDELVQVIRGALRGMQVMSQDVSQALTRGMRKRHTRDGSDDFTEREKEVLLLVAEGKANKDIAEELHISIKTVKTHVSNLLMKCEVEDRTQLAIYAFRRGWADPNKS
jgi:two-component system, NarL family, response regulator LiaR